MLDFNKKNKEVEDINYSIGEMRRVSNEFKEILRENDKLYTFKIGFILSYTSGSGYNKIEIYPEDNEFDSRQYFIDNFENKNGLEKLAEFANKNNVGLITY